MLEAVLCLGLGISVILFIGIPFSYFFWEGKEIELNSFWATSFIGGISICCLIVKILFMVDIPVEIYGRQLYIAFAIFFVGFVYKKRREIALIKSIKNLWGLGISLSVGSLHGITYIVYGAKYYKAYAWWDIYYYGAQAEAVKSIPFSKWADLVYSKPWMLGTTYFTNGVHRISCGALGGMFATLAGVDGCTAMGSLIVLSSISLFWALMYATREMFLSKTKHSVVCLFATMIPGIVVAQMECFIPVVFFLSFLVFYCRCLGDYVERINVKRFVFLSVVISTSITMLLDGTYLILGLIVLGVLWRVNQKGIKEGVIVLGNLIGVVVLSIVLNQFYWQYLYKELHWKMSRDHLNGIYGFAYTPQAFDWLFYGDLLGNFPWIVYTVLTFIAIFLFGYGLFGLSIKILKDKDWVCCNFMAIFCVSLFF